MNPVTELNYGGTQCYLIQNSLLVDAAWPGTRNAFLKCAWENKIEMQGIKYLLLTHFHPDHMDIAQELADLGFKIVGLDVQREYIHFCDKMCAQRVPFTPIDETKVLMVSCKESHAFLQPLGISGEVLHTPGHSPDRVSVLLDCGIAVVGDLPPLALAEAYQSESITQS